MPQDPQLAEIESGLSEGVASYHLGKLADARRIFAAMLSRPDEEPDRRRRALYYLEQRPVGAGEAELARR